VRIELPEFLERILRRLREAPRGYLAGPALFALAVGLLIASLTIETGVVATAFEIGDVPPGIAERNVSFRATPLFNAHLVTGDCGTEFHLLNDSAYKAYQTTGALPRPTLDCNQREATVDGRVSHLVTNYTASPGSPNSSYALSATFLGPRAPYAILSIPGAGLALAATIWVSMTILGRGTERLLAHARMEIKKRDKK
jgi:hypothetical protein